MIKCFRSLFLLAAAGGGAWGAFRVLDEMVKRVDGGRDFHLTSEATLLVIPVCILGALIGALIGGILFPKRLQ
jgi:hypothetical protein